MLMPHNNVSSRDILQWQHTAKVIQVWSKGTFLLCNDVSNLIVYIHLTLRHKMPEIILIHLCCLFANNCHSAATQHLGQLQLQAQGEICHFQSEYKKRDNLFVIRVSEKLTSFQHTIIPFNLKTICFHE